MKNRVTVRLQIRIENGNGFLPEQEFFGGTWTAARTFPRENDVFNPTVVAPRFGLVWMLWPITRWTVSLSIGRFCTQGPDRAGALLRNPNERRVPRILLDG